MNEDLFRYSICDPLKKDPIEMGDIGKEKILDVLDRFPWTAFLDKMDSADDRDIHFSPSLEFENKSTRHGITISIVEKNEFYIFYKRPKMISKLFGISKTMNQNFLSDRTGQTIKDVREAVSALIANDVEVLEERWG